MPRCVTRVAYCVLRIACCVFTFHVFAFPISISTLYLPPFIIHHILHSSVALQACQLERPTISPQAAISIAHYMGKYRYSGPFSANNASRVP